MTFSAFNELKTLSAKLGNDPLLVQAAGGNTSIKHNGTMWIKASGTWLKDAASKDIFVPLKLAELQAALALDSPACENCLDFVDVQQNSLKLCPSIETSVHGLMPQRVVLHVHCVNTIAWSIRLDAAKLIESRLDGFNWSFVPYARPGLELARAISLAMKPGTDVLILGNHGMAVAADTVGAAHKLLLSVVAALQRKPRPAKLPDIAKLRAVAIGTSYVLPNDARVHGFATEKSVCKLAANHVYYPDHVVFLGAKVPQDFSGDAPAIALPSAGVLVHKAAKPSVEPMLACLSEVFLRLDSADKLQPLTGNDVARLLNWDAEKYRQTLSIP
jgi:rhamnose utilization protein RhaD (predicted bifunctional aldolase and dehydrogenase)